MVRMLQDVVVEARLHRRDGELLAARARAEKDRQVEALLPDAAEEVERVDPARPMVGHDDVEEAGLEQGPEALGILELDDPTAGKAGLQRASAITARSRGFSSTTRIRSASPVAPDRPVAAPPAVESENIV